MASTVTPAAILRSKSRIDNISFIAGLASLRASCLQPRSGYATLHIIERQPVTLTKVLCETPANQKVFRYGEIQPDDIVNDIL
jgi:hypothetical protein